MNILNLARFDVKHTEEQNYDYVFVVETNSPPLHCPKCGVVTPKVTKHDSKKQMFTDTPMHGKRVRIWVKRQRYMCQECHSTFFEGLIDMDERRAITRRLALYIEKQALLKPFTTLANEVGLDEKTIRLIFKDFVIREEKSIKFEAPRCIGIDEAHLLHNYRCVITDVENNRIIDLLRDRKTPTVVGYLQRLPGIRNVECASMDMWKPYKDAINTVRPGIPIIVDKFHVVKMANKALEDIRKIVRRTLTDKQRKTLMHDRYVLLTRRSKLSASAYLKMESWTRNIPAIGQMYSLKEEFFDIYNCTSKKEAMERYFAWKASIPPNMKAPFKDLLTAMKNWETEIFNYFDMPITNAYTEALNGLIKIANRQGRGYSFDVLRAKVMFSNGLRRPIKPRYNKQIPDSVMWQLNSMFEISKPERYQWKCGIDITTLTQKMEQGLI